jgi:hypothetical protein
MITDDLFQYISAEELREIFRCSDRYEIDEVEDTDILDYLYEVQTMELRPRIYRGDYGELLWCVEVYDWSKKKECHIKNLVGFKSRREAVHISLIWYYEEYSVKNG